METVGLPGGKGRKGESENLIHLQGPKDHPDQR